jgi:hypothetical protein
LRLRAALANSRSSARVGGTFALVGRHEPNFIRGSCYDLRFGLTTCAFAQCGKSAGSGGRCYPVRVDSGALGRDRCLRISNRIQLDATSWASSLAARSPAVGGVRVRSQVATTSACKSSASFVLALSDSVAPDLPERPIRAGGEAPGSPSSAQSGLMCCACAFCSMGLRR